MATGIQSRVPHPSPSGDYVCSCGVIFTNLFELQQHQESTGHQFYTRQHARSRQNKQGTDENSNLGDLLKNLQSEGKEESKDSSFVIDAAQARRVLGGQLFSDPGIYVLKVYQALVEAGAERIETRLRRHDITIRGFGLNAVMLDPDAVQQNLNEMGRTSHRTALGQLTQGLLAASATDYSEVSWSVADGKEIKTLLLKPGTDEMQTNRATGNSFVQFRLRRPWRLLVMCSESAYLRGRIVAEPNFFRLDLSLTERFEATLGSPLHLMQTALSRNYYTGDSVGFYYQAKTGGYQDVDEVNVACDTFDGQEPWDRIVGITQELDRGEFGPGRLFYIQNGVILEPIFLPHYPGLLVFQNCLSIKTDITGLIPLESPTDEYLKRLESEASLAARQALKGVESIRYAQGAPKETKQTASKVMLTLGLIAAASPTSVLAIAGAFTAPLYLIRKMQTQGAPKLQKKLRAALVGLPYS